MNNYFKNHPMYIKNIQNKEKNIKYHWHKLQKETWFIFNHLNKKINILEIGFWNWYFTYFCKKNRFKNYTWIDIDNTYMKQHKKEFKNYIFHKTDIIDFLQKNKGYDIIFMSHVFEHLDEKQAKKAINLIYSALNKGWYLINYMPNADSFKAASLRYIDITHKKIYNSHSFEQIALSNNANFSYIKHFNTLPAILPFKKVIFQIIHPIFKIFTIIYFYWMWLMFPKIYTSEILSIMQK